ncbi:hypothetical protein SAMN04487960_101422 [Marinobacter mobilis]|uniref:Secreted protein n=1 Tax=Marinobacter mobilis TaxID=488533 RepID=A0A1H2R5Y3_9GAMM|nr:hypothetical protein SAMN04487960_101422 [Marinobacter mobilis]
MTVVLVTMLMSLLHGLLLPCLSVTASINSSSKQRDLKLSGIRIPYSKVSYKAKGPEAFTPSPCEPSEREPSPDDRKPVLGAATTCLSEVSGVSVFPFVDHPKIG